jgi:hypothetical protein
MNYRNIVESNRGLLYIISCLGVNKMRKVSQNFLVSCDNLPQDQIKLNSEG